MEEILVSINCLVYNHEKYIRKCLDGLVMQKTKFKYEILIHDDASTDNSANIIREYEEKYPELIKPIFQTENQYSKGISINRNYQYPRAKGKYIAYCEGDDFWTDENKLQKQFDALETNPNCGICVHNVCCINEDGSENPRKFPEVMFDEGVISGKKILNYYPKWLFHLTSFFIKKDLLLDLYENNSNLSAKSPVGDTLIQYFSAANKDFYYINENMSTYRLLAIGSWTTRLMNSKDNYISTCNRFIEFTKEFSDYCYNNDYSNYEIKKTFSDAIDLYEVEKLLHNREYKKIYKFRKCNYFKERNKKLKLVVYLSYFIPGFEFLYKRNKFKA